MISEPQRGALHLYCERLAEALNDAGYDQRKVLKPGIAIPWTKESVKKQLFKAIAKAMFDVDSTEKLTKPQVSDVYETLNRHMAEKFGVSVEWPHREEE